MHLDERKEVKDGKETVGKGRGRERDKGQGRGEEEEEGKR
jgi:hypothetical protein